MANYNSISKAFAFFLTKLHKTKGQAHVAENICSKRTVVLCLVTGGSFCVLIFLRPLKQVLQIERRYTVRKRNITVLIFANVLS